MKSVSRRLHGGGTVAALIAVLLSPETAKAEGNVVPIDRSPILLSAAMPDDLVCVFDEDDDGLDDEIEEQIAQAFVPQFRFDADEEHTGAAEPHAVFNMRATLDEDGSVVLHVKYVDGSGIQACRDTDGKLGEGQVRLLGESSALAPVSAKRLLVVRGPYVVDVDLSDPSAPVAQGTENASTALRWLRADRLSGRAYGVGVGGVMHRQPVFKVEQGALELTGQHDVPEWVKRLDAQRMSVSVKGPKRVDVAEVLR